MNRILRNPELALPTNADKCRSIGEPNMRLINSGYAKILIVFAKREGNR